MLTNAIGAGKKATSLMQEYSLLLGDAMLLQRARSAEQTARIEAELANRVKQEFIANMSHELRTPLNTVIGFAKLLGEQTKRKATDLQIADYGNLILASAEHLLSVINDILDISKIQSGRYTIDAQEIRIDELLLRVIERQAEAGAAAKVAIRHRIDRNLPVLRGEPAKLEQALENLFNNAIKFTVEGGTVNASASQTVDGGVAITICDTGIGMSDEEVAVAVTPFGQVDASRSRWREGTGLGLPIAKALIGLHGGSLEINSAKGVGTEVMVRLPSPKIVSPVTK
ncbi:MAG: HAMP domain-containing histidine kinase [Hyphomicrobiaceae bacterium]|nr:MAG: HAMP domain-containing histidine kinase [Hyphomicrobiaceae bacterium]